MRRVTLEIGKLSGVMSEAIAFCFDTVAAGTALEGAGLEIREIEGRARCDACGAEFATETLFAPCACGSFRLTRLEGEELNVKIDGTDGGGLMCGHCGCGEADTTVLNMETGKETVMRRDHRARHARRAPARHDHPHDHEHAHTHGHDHDHGRHDHHGDHHHRHGDAPPAVA